MPENILGYSTIYIEITDKQIAVGILQKKNKYYRLENIEYEVLKNLEVINGIIFNQISLFSLINNAISKFKTKKPCKAIVSFPRNNDQIDRYPEEGRILQAALCIAKTGVAVERVINESLLQRLDSPIHQRSILSIPNLLQPYIENKEKSVPTIFIASIIFLIIIGMYCFQKNVQTKKINNNLKNDLNCLEQQLSKIIINKDSINEEQKKISDFESAIFSIEDLVKTNTSYAPILKVISDQIPEQVILTSLKIGRKNNIKPITPTPKQNQKLNKQKIVKDYSMPISIKGLSPNPDLVISFNKSLNNSGLFKKTRITSLSKNKPSKEKFKKAGSQKKYINYSFIINATILFS